MGTHRHRNCVHVEGAVVCVAEFAPEDREVIGQFGRYLRGEMSAREKAAFTGMDGGDADDLGRVARIMEVEKGNGTLAECRDAAGLSLGQAATVTGLSRERLRALEGGAEATDEERRTLCLAYAVDGWIAPKGAAGE